MQCKFIVLFSGFRALPIQKKTFTVIRSPFVHKKSQEHFGIFSKKVNITFKTSNFACLTLLITITNRGQLPRLMNLSATAY